ncbi:MAG TPA: precorrin-6y C5,15-methyltransferase (decarboxylating) subunit CbiE, partial [Dehalococcoidia bacterium]|nr:precorrin-6y C5,15-methyltransferase (decarboxylating) subunit CbiE [Dehalococcoidia bacterium]
MTAPQILIVGVGAGGPQDLDREALAAIERAGLIVGGRRHLEWLAEHPSDRWVIGSDVPALLDRLAARLDAASDLRCVVLASGDPCCFGIGPLIVARFGRDRVRILPTIGSVPLLFNRIGEDWHDVRILSAHGRPPDPVVAEVARSARAAILTDDVNTPSRIAEELLAAGLADTSRFVVGEQLGGPNEAITEARLADLPGRTFDRLNVVAVFRDATDCEPAPAIGRPDETYAHRAGMITKAEIRAISLGLLRLRPASRVWDIGAGCGSLAIEAAGLAARGEVWAVEADPDQAALLAENRRRFRAANLRVVAGCAPEALRDLPDPDTIFVGGSGGRLRPILSACRDR